MTQEIIHIPRLQIEAGKNDRKIFDEAALAHLAASINKHGLLQPPTVRPIGKTADGLPLYEIVAGERRIRALDVLGWELIPCLVRELSDEEASALMLAENTARVDLDPITEANAYQVRVTRFDWSYDRIAETAGVSVDLVKERLKLLRLVPEVQHFVRTRALPIGHAMAMIDLDANRQRIALRVFNASVSMPLAGFKEVVKRLQEEQDSESQMGLFTLEMQMIEEVKADSAQVTRGKTARTGALSSGCFSAACGKQNPRRLQGRRGFRLRRYAAACAQNPP